MEIYTAITRGLLTYIASLFLHCSRIVQIDWYNCAIVLESGYSIQCITKH